MAKTRQKKEKDALDQLLYNIDFRGLIQKVVGKDGLSGFQDAVRAVYPKTRVQLHTGCATRRSSFPTRILKRSAPN